MPAGPATAPAPAIGADAQWSIDHPGSITNATTDVFFTLILTGQDALVRPAPAALFQHSAGEWERGLHLTSQGAFAAMQASEKGRLACVASVAADWPTEMRFRSCLYSWSI